MTAALDAYLTEASIDRAIDALRPDDAALLEGRPRDPGPGVGTARRPTRAPGDQRRIAR